jgi:coenzyme F420-reducing hydrogenase delta subunit
VPKVNQAPENSVEIRQDQCQACGICIEECPARAIVFNSSCFEDMDRELEDALAMNGSEILLLYCYYGAGSIPGLADLLEEGLISSVSALRVPCISKLGVSYFLKAFELGAKGILVLDCVDNDCIYSQAALWYKRHIESTRQILKDLGLRQERIEEITVCEERVQDLKEKLDAFVKQE